MRDTRNDIIVVGAGHGGLVAAAKLAREGFNVRVYEKNDKNNLSWDWRDNIENDALERAGLPKLDPSLILIPESYYFTSPNGKHFLPTDIPLEFRNITVERRVFINHLLDYALQSGVEVFFKKNIEGPIIKDEIIIGVKSGEEAFYGSLIIDSAGFHTPIRPNLPNNYRIFKKLNRGELFYTYRGYYEKNKDAPNQESRFRLILGYKYKRGIAWVNTSHEYADILIGCIDPYEDGELKALINELRKDYPVIGEKLLRGGIIAPIPIRRAAYRFVGPNYALIGDAANMTRPINGSGVSNSLIAGDLLAKAIINAFKKNDKPLNDVISYSTAELWPYQYQYYQEVGGENAFIDILKNYILTLDFKTLDFAFQKRLLTAKDIEAGVTGGELELSLFNLIGRLIRGCSRVGILLNLGKNIRKGKSVQKHILNIPKEYDEMKVIEWIKKAESYFKQYDEKLQAGYGKLTFSK